MSDAGHQCLRGSRRLWSLWDIMKRFSISSFLTAADMGGKAFVRIELDRRFPPKLGSDMLDCDTIAAYAGAYDFLEEDCIELGLTASLATIRKIQSILRNSYASHSDLLPLELELRGRIKDETNAKIFFALTTKETELYEPIGSLFGQQTQAGFPSAAYDIDEAAKCLALGRSTASAFHSLRCLEAAIRAMSRCLAIPDPTKAADRNWGKMLGLVKREIERRWPTGTDRLTGDGQTFDELHAALAAMQNPWRNATMHLDKKYTEEEAEHIFDVVGGLMRRVASRCDEDGEPKA
jgi:hypothetical protein